MGEASPIMGVITSPATIVNSNIAGIQSPSTGTASPGPNEGRAGGPDKKTLLAVLDFLKRNKCHVSKHSQFTDCF